MHNQLSKKVELHYVIQGFQSKQGIGMTSLEVSLPNQRAEIWEEVQYKIFLNFHKAYDAMDL